MDCRRCRFRGQLRTVIFLYLTYGWNQRSQKTLWLENLIMAEIWVNPSLNLCKLKNIVVPSIYLATVFAGLFLRLNLKTHYKFCRYFHIHVVKQKAGSISSICPVSVSNPGLEAFSGQSQTQMFFLTNLKLCRIFSDLLCSPFLETLFLLNFKVSLRLILKVQSSVNYLPVRSPFNHH